MSICQRNKNQNIKGVMPKIPDRVGERYCMEQGSFKNLLFIDFALQEQDIPLFKTYEVFQGLYSLCRQEMWFSKPVLWKDPFESLFYRSTYNSMPFGLKDRCYISCFALTRTQEPQWNMYSGGRASMRFQYRIPDLLMALDEYCTNNNCKAYIGYVNYQTTANIERCQPRKVINSQDYTLWSDVDWVRLLLLKRNAFIYENELRIVVVQNESDSKCQGIAIKGLNNSTTIWGVQLGPDMAQSYKEELQDVLINQYGFSPAKDKNGKTTNRVTNSRLYQDVKPKNFK